MVRLFVPLAFLHPQRFRKSPLVLKAPGPLFDIPGQHLKTRLQKGTCARNKLQMVSTMVAFGTGKYHIHVGNNTGINRVGGRAKPLNNQGTKLPNELIHALTISGAKKKVF